jgi:hypothetical protein
VTGFSFGNATQIELPSHGKSFLTSMFLKYSRCISFSCFVFTWRKKRIEITWCWSHGKNI